MVVITSSLIGSNSITITLFYKQYSSLDVVFRLFDTKR